MHVYRSSLLAAAALLASAGPLPAATPDNGGPYNATFLAGGIGIERDLGNAGSLARAGGTYSITAWARPTLAQHDVTLVSIGDPAGACRCLSLRNERLIFSDGGATVTSAAIPLNSWTDVAVVSDGSQIRLYVNGREAGRAAAHSIAVSPRIGIAPVVEGHEHFGGTLIGATVEDSALTPAEIASLYRSRPDFDLVQIWKVGQGWEWQKTANTGYWQQQDPWTLPQSKVAYSAPVAKTIPVLPPLQPEGDNRWIINGWHLAAAPDLRGDGEELSRPGAPSGQWYTATVPGTVLTTLVDRGVYPDPYYGLNNLRIPEKLARQNYWYRTSFTVPPEAAGKALHLIFNGINYESRVWANGRLLGGTKGAFIRGQFDLVPVTGENVIAVEVLPPPHPGIPHEQSIKAGVGLNGGQLAIDGPTFVATEGWDWIPGIRDRDTGLWLPVELEATGPVQIGDPHVVTDLPLPRTDSADIYITVPVRNDSPGPQTVTVRATFDNVSVEQSVNAPPGLTEVEFAPSTYPQLHVLNPRLWWPNGYGDPALHDLTISASDGGAISDTKKLRFGIREVSYDLSLFDSAGQLRRVNVQPTDGGLRGEKFIDVTHTAIKQSPHGYAESLTPAGEHSRAVVDIPDVLPEPHLVIRVNGVKIAARGGSWGMDDALKRSGRDRLEPYFRLEREAHMNIVRNWMGTNTEPAFYDLADENGMMVLNDFWQSTQNFQVEPEDPQLFIANARDAISRYRNHPSIVVWFGRNEGVPYPMLNEGLDDAVAELDGTRWYTGSSNVINLQGSGPYNYRPPVGYFTDLATGFSVETGTPSLATLESVSSYIPPQDRWPISDVLAYHDWHFSGNGDTKTFMAALDTMFGPATSFEDFERKAQMMNLETHKAIYEGFLGHLWTKNSGRLQWMTHPAWPSNMWQIYSWDYDTNASYYGAKKATEPLHIQMNLPGNEVVVVNTTRQDANGLTAKEHVVSIDNRELFERSDRVDAKANQTTTLPPLPLDSLMAKDPMVFVELGLVDSAGRTVSDNFYWRGKDTSSYRALDGLPQVPLVLTAQMENLGAERSITAVLSNNSRAPALNAKLTLVDEKGDRILPAFYSDNYVSLLPGESRTITIRYSSKDAALPSLTLRGWNIVEQHVKAVGGSAG
jgi:hypothetical protein